MLDSWQQDGVLVMKMAHGKVNALDLELLESLTAAFRQAPADVPVVLTGQRRVFSAGVDLQRIVQGGGDYVRRFLPALSEAFLSVFEHPTPVVAAVNGHALAGGFVLAAACDLRVAAPDPADVGVTELLVGVPFPTAAIEIVRHAVGDAHASRLVYTGARIDLREAHRIGLVTELVDDATGLLDVAVARAAEVGGRPQAAYRLSKMQLRRDALDRIARHRPADDRAVADAWAAAETIASIDAYLTGLRARSE